MHSKKEINKYLGYKFFKELDDGTFEVIRLIRIYPFNNKVGIINLETGTKKSLSFELLKGYTPLEPYGFAAFTRVIVNNGDMKQKDVMVTLYRLLDIKLDINEPYAICRQSITDFFYNLVADDLHHDIVGVSVTRDNCPPNIPYHLVAACDEVERYEMVNFYLDDTVKDILTCINQEYYNEALKECFDLHIKESKKFLLSNKPSVDGWCQTLETLLKENNFITDMDSLRDIAALDFNLSDYLLKEKKNDVEVDKLNPEALDFFRNTFKVNTIDTIVVKFDYDIDLADFKNTNYTLIRDNQDTLYIVSYLVDGEYFEKDLEEEQEKTDVTTKLRLAFYNKYYSE